MAYITIWHWMNKDVPAYFAHDAYWGMVGGDSNTAKIVRCNKYKSTRYEQHSIDEYETVTFDSGHRVYITNSNGTSCNITVYPPIDPCEGIICPDYCDDINHIKYYNGECIDGECVYNIIENSEECSFDPCEGIICEDVCIATDLYSQKCIDGLCITDQLLERNSLSCGYIPPEEPPIDDEIEPPSDLTKLILPIGIGIGLLLLSRK